MDPFRYDYRLQTTIIAGVFLFAAIAATLRALFALF